MIRLILMDLDGTLLRSDKTISPHTVSVLEECRRRGYLIGIATARGETNARQYIRLLRPQLVISSGGALARHGDRVVYQCAFSSGEVKAVIQAGLALAGGRCGVTVDTMDAYYSNTLDDVSSDWGEVRYSDFTDFQYPAFKICMDLPNETLAPAIAAQTSCDWAKFSDSSWYKFTKPAATKEEAIEHLAESLGIAPENIIAFGDDYVDIGMLRVCGRGIAMGNAIGAVKAVADDVALFNDEDGVADYLEKHLL